MEFPLGNCCAQKNLVIPLSAGAGAEIFGDKPRDFTPDGQGSGRAGTGGVEYMQGARTAHQAKILL